jgi:sugar/nucleoside kinase (ribokinase family)
MTDQSAAAPYVVVIGDALIDEIHTDGSSEDFVGGAALNVAVGLSTLGVNTRLIAMVGDDADGATIRAYLARHNVDLIPTVGPNGSSRGVSDRVDGEPFYVFNAAAQARRVAFGPAESAALESAALVVVSCFPFDDVEQSDELAAAISNAKARLVIDPNPRDSMLHSADRFRETFDRLAPNTLLVKVGDDDSALLYGTSVGELSTHLLAEGTPAVLATAGSLGASVEIANGVTAQVPIAALDGPIVDTMGAGDATLASVVQSILAEGFPVTSEDWQRILRRAMLIAAATCRSRGALLQLPPAEESVADDRDNCSAQGRSDSLH